MQSFFYFNLFFWRSFSLEYFSGKFVEIWAKILRTHKTLPAPTPMLRLAGHIDMLFFWCFRLLSLASAYCSGECCFLPSHSLACGNIFS